MSKSLFIALVFGIAVGFIFTAGCKEKPPDTTYNESFDEQPARTDPPAGKDQATSVVVYITRTGECYHRGNCSYLRQSKIPKDLEYAKKHYRACSRCRPPK